jgi:hypothetical protein
MKRMWNGAKISRRLHRELAGLLIVILDRARLEDFAVANENRPLTDLALEMAVKAGWISNCPKKGPAPTVF